jgi:hypothetical protein
MSYELTIFDLRRSLSDSAWKDIKYLQNGKKISFDLAGRFDFADKKGGITVSSA